MLKTARLLAVLVAVLASVSGCGSSSPSTDPNFVDASGYVKALHAGVTDFEWPADHRPDLDVLASRSSPPPNARVEAGHERVVLSIINTCAWYLSWDAARQRSDDAEASRALDVMATVVPEMHEGDPAGQELAREIATKAELGDPTLALSYASANCDAVKWQ